MRKKLPKIGDRVIIEVGRFEKEGRVIYVSATPPAVEVEYWATGAEEPSRVTYRPEWVRPVETAER